MNSQFSRRSVIRPGGAAGQRTHDNRTSIPRGASEEMPPPKPINLPPPQDLQLETVPNDAFFSQVEQVEVANAAGRICAEMISPYPPEEVIEYVGSGLAAGMQISEAADPELRSVRVTKR